MQENAQYVFWVLYITQYVQTASNNFENDKQYITLPEQQLYLNELNTLKVKYIIVGKITTRHIVK